MRSLRFAAPAIEDMAGLLRWSRETFGAMAGKRYQTLLQAALEDVALDPSRPSSRLRPDLGDGIRLYHLSASRNRAELADGLVRNPRHFIVYRAAGDDLVLVLRVLHDAMDIARHLGP